MKAPQTTLPPGTTAPHLKLKLREGWRYASSSGAFVSNEGSRWIPDKLPQGAKIVYIVPDLGEAEISTLSEDERNLARYLHLILPTGEEPKKYLKAVGAWPSIETVELPPEISLPDA